MSNLCFNCFFISVIFYIGRFLIYNVKLQKKGCIFVKKLSIAYISATVENFVKRQINVLIVFPFWSFFILGNFRFIM